MHLAACLNRVVLCCIEANARLEDAIEDKTIIFADAHLRRLRVVLELFDRVFVLLGERFGNFAEANVSFGLSDAFFDQVS